MIQVQVMIKLHPDGAPYTLSWDEAKKLYLDLKELFDTKSAPPLTFFNTPIFRDPGFPLPQTWCIENSSAQGV
jgi:hypothetical protein